MVYFPKIRNAGSPHPGTVDMGVGYSFWGVLGTVGGEHPWPAPLDARRSPVVTTTDASTHGPVVPGHSHLGQKLCTGVFVFVFLLEPNVPSWKQKLSRQPLSSHLGGAPCQGWVALAEHGNEGWRKPHLLGHGARHSPGRGHCAWDGNIGTR